MILKNRVRVSGPCSFRNYFVPPIMPFKPERPVVFSPGVSSGSMESPLESISGSGMFVSGTGTVIVSVGIMVVVVVVVVVGVVAGAELSQAQAHKFTDITNATMRKVNFFIIECLLFYSSVCIMTFLQTLTQEKKTICKMLLFYLKFTIEILRIVEYNIREIYEIRRILSNEETCC